MDKKKILIIDDGVLFTTIAKDNLESTEEYEVMAVNNPADALAAARKFKPEMIFLDVIMPGMSGGDVAEQFKNDKYLQNVPIVFLTAIMTKEEANLQQNIIKGQSYLAKPATKEELVDCIKNQIG